MRIRIHSQESKLLLSGDFSAFNLPSSPKLVALLLNEFDQKEIDLKNITQLANLDPALAARMLQIANSGFFQRPRSIYSVSESLAMLRLAQVRSMVSAAASNTSLKSVPGINLPQFWNYSVQVARISRSLARLIWQNQQAAFTCGLIHAIGQLAMHIAMPEQMSTFSLKCSPFLHGREKAEMRALGYCHAQVAAAFARKWQFPLQMVEALEHQCAPFEETVYEPLAGILHLASWRARTKIAGLSGKELAVTFPGEVGEILHLDIDMVLQQDPINWKKTSPCMPWLGYDYLNY